MQYLRIRRPAQALLGRCRSNSAGLTSRNTITMGRIRSGNVHFYSATSLAGQQSWWNPMRVFQGSSKAAAPGKGENSPRKIQERKDLIVTTLALEYRRISMNDESMDREDVIDLAFEELQKKNLDDLTILQLRNEMQSMLQPQLEELFQTFRFVDEKLPADLDVDDTVFQDILQEELEFTLDELEDPERADKGASPLELLDRKRAAIETLLEHRSQEKKNDGAASADDAGVSEGEQQQDSATVAAAATTDIWSEADSFGYRSRNDPSIDSQIRHYQTVNMCRASRLKEILGYSIISLQSSIAGAGRGVYVDGFAKAGSLLVFQPGEVWMKEHLLNLPYEVEKTLEKNDSYQMSLRGDDHLIDSRKSPYTVLSDKNSNAFALGHVVNHATPTNPPNCKSVLVNWTKDMILTGAEKYIPNTYARPPTLTLMGSLWEKEAVEMHGMCLIASRDICNEEIFYDYRLQTSHMPKWYHRVVDTDFEAETETEDGIEAEVTKEEGKQ